MLRILVFISAQLIACSGLKWSGRLHSTGTSPVELTLCSGDNIRLFWNYTLDDGELVTSTEWTCQPAGKTTPELLATYVEGEKGGNFLPTSPFSGRVLRLTGGGLEVSCATISESGTYRIAVTTLSNVTGVTMVHRNTAQVEVVDSPKTRSGQLEIRQHREVTKDPTSGELHVQLACGNFSDLGHPAVEVLWKTPTGGTLRSSSFDNSTGDSNLLVPNPVKGGQYTCTLGKPAAGTEWPKARGEERENAKVTASTHCLEPDSPLLGEAFVQVDETSARFSLLEAKQQELQEQIEAGHRRLAEYVTNATEVLEERLDQNLATYYSGAVAFHAQLKNPNPAWRNGLDLVLSKVLVNEGFGYNSSSGRFTAPANGTYFFIATIELTNRNMYTRMYLHLMKEGDPEPKAVLSMDNAYKRGTSFVILQLEEQDQVLLRRLNPHDMFYFSAEVTFFSGFRLN